MENSDINMGLLRDSNRKTLFDFLDSFDGLKAIIWDDDLKKPFDLIISGFSELQQHGVSVMFTLKSGQVSPAVDAQVQHVLYLTRAHNHKVQAIIDNVIGLKGDQKRRHHVVFVPDATTVCRRKLREAGVDSSLESVKELPVRLFSWHADVATLLSRKCLSSLLSDNNWTPLYEVALSLDQLQTVFGPIARFHCKGEWAKKALELYKKKRRQRDDIALSDTDNGNSQSLTRRMTSLVDDVILIDRWIDPVTPLVTQLTYEGLIDEMFGIKFGLASLPSEVSGEEKTGGLRLREEDKDALHAQLRDLNFNAVGPALSHFIRQLSDQIDQRHEASSVREYKEFVKQLPRLQADRQSAARHTAVAELLKQHTSADPFLQIVQCEQELLNGLNSDRASAYIETAICKAVTASKVLRLICLHSLASDGLKTKVLDAYRKLFLQTYGYDYADVFIRLEKVGLIRERTRTKSVSGHYASSAGQPDQSFAALSKSFRLLVTDVDEKCPNDASYVYSGYCPLTARLCQSWLHSGWNEPALSRPVINGESKRPVIVFVIGGITYSEIAALRFIASKDDHYDFLIVSTHFINGESMLNEIRGVDL